MGGSLVNYEMAFELAELTAANMAYSHGNIEGAIGHLTSLACLLNTELPCRPIPKPSYFDNLKTQSRYYFECKRIVSSGINRTVTKVRVSYGQPFQIKRADSSIDKAIVLPAGNGNGKNNP